MKMNKSRLNITTYTRTYLCLLHSSTMINKKSNSIKTNRGKNY